MNRIIEIDREIEELERKKKNYARRINYRIKKLKDERSRLLEIEDGLKDIPVFSPPETKEEIKAFHKTPDMEVSDIVKNKFEVGTKKQKPKRLDFTRETFDKKAALSPEPFELIKEDIDYDRFADNRWTNHNFLEFSPGDIMRVRVDGKVKEIEGGTAFEVVSLPYTDNEIWRHALKIKHVALPLKNIREEIASRLKGKTP